APPPCSAKLMTLVSPAPDVGRSARGSAVPLGRTRSSSPCRPIPISRLPRGSRRSAQRLAKGGLGRPRIVGPSHGIAARPSPQRTGQRSLGRDDAAARRAEEHERPPVTGLG